MEREIKQPNIVKGIPAPLIRPLPTLYYYGVYFKKNGFQRACKLFEQTVNYLVDGLTILTSELRDDNLDYILDLTSQLINAEDRTIVDKVIQITSLLSDSCRKFKEKIANNPKFSKENFAQLYKSKVAPLNILLIDNANEPLRASRLTETFTNTCYYNVAASNLHADNFLDNINACDFIIFTSAYPITVNEQVQDIQSYRKPCVIMAELKKDKKYDQQTLRNGAWLKQRGHEVLFKIFTPLRLFTTIDKVYMKYQFAN